MDAKFYTDPSPRSSGTPKIRSSHLYQLFAYMKHASEKAPGLPVRGALVYAAGPALDPLQLATLLVRAGAVRAMQLDINPFWPDFVTYRPQSAHGLAAPSNGRKLISRTVQGAGTFFEPAWARDFITMSARPAR